VKMKWTLAILLLLMLSIAEAKEDAKKSKTKSHHHVKTTKLRSKDTTTHAKKSHHVKTDKSVSKKKMSEPSSSEDDKKDETPADWNVDATNTTIRKKWLVFSMGCKLPEEEHPVIPPKHEEYGWEFQSVRLDACVPTHGGERSYKWEYKSEWEVYFRTYSDENCHTVSTSVQKEIPSKCETDSFGQSMRYEYGESPVNVAYYSKYEKSTITPQVVSYFQNPDACEAGPDQAYLVRSSSSWTCVKNEDSEGTSTTYEQNLDGISVCQGYKNTECTYENWRDVTCESYKNCKHAFTNDDFGEYYTAVEDTGHTAQLEIYHNPDCWYLGFIPRC